MGQPHQPKYLDANGLLKTGPGILHEVSLTPAAATATATIYDETSATGTIIAKLSGAANGGSTRFAPNGGVVFNKGCYVAITGVGAVVNSAFD
jgi:hypothetical protein